MKTKRYNGCVRCGRFSEKMFKEEGFFFCEECKAEREKELCREISEREY